MVEIAKPGSTVRRDLTVLLPVLAASMPQQVTGTKLSERLFTTSIGLGGLSVLAGPKLANSDSVLARKEDHQVATPVPTSQTRIKRPLGATLLGQRDRLWRVRRNRRSPLPRRRSEVATRPVHQMEH